jgi:REP element-mobilizing transposase RayT
MSRGDRREAIYLDDEDRRMFVDLLKESCGRSGWEMVSWVLMDNHFHLQVHTPEANLVKTMKWMLGTYTIRFNRRHRLTGHLFQGRYKALPIEEGDYLLRVSDYIHLNPVRAGLVDWEQRADVLKAYPWSSYLELAGYSKSGLCARQGKRVLSWCGLKAKDWRLYRRRMNQLARHERHAGGQGWEDLRGGWCLGGESFQQEILERVGQWMKPKRRDSFNGDAFRRHDAREAERLVQSALRQLKWTEKRLKATARSAPEKEVIAAAVRKRCLVDRAWLAQRLEMGHPSSITRAVMRMQSGGSGAHQKLARMLKFTD